MWLFLLIPLALLIGMLSVAHFDNRNDGQVGFWEKAHNTSVGNGMKVPGGGFLEDQL